MVRDYLPILTVDEPSLITWLNQYGLAKVCIVCIVCIVF